MVASGSKRKGSPCERDGDYQGDEVKMYLGPSLPEDIWQHIHSLMPMRDAARVACVSRAFVPSWRCHPNLTFSNETLGLNKNARGKDGSDSIFSSIVYHILTKHSGIGLMTLKIQIPSDFSAKDYCYIDGWLRTALTLGIKELTLILHPLKSKYNFPYSLLSNGSGNSIRYLHLVRCSFCPTATLSCLRSLTRLYLCHVRVTGDELGCLFPHSLALERLEVRYCDGIVRLKVPCILQRLSYLEVLGGDRLEAIDNEAPNISTFLFEGDNAVKLSLGETLQMKRVKIQRSGSVFYARTELPSRMLNLEALTLRSDREVWQQHMKHVSIFADPSDLRQMQEHRHHNLKDVRIRNFCCAKSLVELACHVAESVTSLECLTLEAPQSVFRCSDRDNRSGKCCPMDRDILVEAHRAILAIRRYIEPKVPSTVKLHVLEPCSCHAV